MAATDADVLSAFHPLVRDWFTETLGDPSAPQVAGWPAIANGSDTLILAPTGTGKTLAAFLWELDALIRRGQDEPLPNAIQLLYVSPLKALSNDIQRNLEHPLAELKRRFERAGQAFPEIRVAVRTGDTPSAARARMLRKTPHVLITTPESLHLLLTSPRGRTMFTGLRAVIVDEIHAVAGTKRGAHLALTLERLTRVAGDAPQRIGLSATQRPLEEIARFLGGCNLGPNEATVRYRPVTIVDCGLVKRMDVAVVAPVDDLTQVDGTIWNSVAPLVLKQMQPARTTLVFVNNRAQAEKMAARLNTLAGEEVALPYHGSLSRERRLLLEEQLKGGELRALVTTSALELGIDVGSVDLVVQLQSPKRVAAGLQRVGRAGHTLKAVSRGVFVPTFRDDALEQLAIVRAMSTGDVEPTRVVQNALDVLAQLIVAIVGSETPEWTAADLFDFVRGAYPYHALSRAAFDETVAMLSGKYPSDVASELEARIHWDRQSDTLTPSRSARLVATISGGTIPDRGLYAVQLSDRTRLGELDEEFVHESRVGDVFQLGSSTWRIRAIEHDRVIVMPAPGAPARMPFWHGEMMARSRHLSPAVGELRRHLDAVASAEDAVAVQQRYRADEATVASLVRYVQAQHVATGRVPDEQRLVLEQFRDEVGSIRMVLHSPFGGRLNAPWGMALARRLRDQLGIAVQVQTTDDALMIRLPALGEAPPIDALLTLDADEAERLVLEEIGGSSLFGARFRMNAARALLLPRGGPRRRMPLWLQRLKAADLLEAVRGYPSFPILVETYREVLQDAFDMDGLRDVLNRIQAGTLGIHVALTETPSPFAQSLQLGFVMDWMYADDTPRAESRAALLSLDRALLDELMGGAGADEPTLVVLQEVLAARRGTSDARRARDADELAVLVDRAGDLTWDELQLRIAPPDEWRKGSPVEALLAGGRLVAADLPGLAERRFFLVDAYPRYAAAFGADAVQTILTGTTIAPRDATEAIPAVLRDAVLTVAAARREVLARFLSLAGPVSLADVLARYHFPTAWVQERLEEWQRAGRLVRGTFGTTAETRWCTRRLLEQARRRELAQARRQIAAVSIPDYAWFLQQWQHLAPDTRLSGANATATVMAQLYGLSRPADAWERHYLPSRLQSYDQSSLGALAATGQLVWAAESLTDRSTQVPRDDVSSGTPRHTESRFAAMPLGRIRFLERGTGHLWLTPALPDEQLSDGARDVLAALRAHGASFTTDLAVATSAGPERLRQSLRELVVAGLVTNDTIESLRDVLRSRPAFPLKRDEEPDPTRWLPADFTRSPRPVVQRRVNPRRLARWRRPDRPGVPQWGGRWSLLHTPGTLGDGSDATAAAEDVARQWLVRYGVVSRDWWRRERPAMSWRELYMVLKRMEFRGDVRRGYFVAGLSGAQFALPEAVEHLRTAAARSPQRSSSSGIVAMVSSDPANVYALPLPGESDADPLSRPRGAGAVLVTVEGRVLLTAESRGKRIRVRDDASPELFLQGVSEMLKRLTPRDPLRPHRHVVDIETINGEPAAASPYTDALRSLGFRSQGRAMRHLPKFS